MPSVVDCPSCKHPLHIPDELRGRPVRCPACGQVFMLPPAAEVPAKTDEEPENNGQEPLTALPVSDDEETEDAADRPPEATRQVAKINFDQARMRVYPAALGLVMIGTVGLFLGLACVALYAKGIRIDVKKLPQIPDAQRPDVEKMLEGPTPLVFGIVFSVLNFVILLAARQMFHLLYWRFAVVGSILALLSALLNPCCYIGIAFAIYSLTVLYNPRVRHWFE